VQPLFFGDRETSLFGCLHPSDVSGANATGVVLCPPLGFEYHRSHRAFRTLGKRLAKKGYPVLRFDYTGCGDSSGDDDDIRLPRLIEDVALALSELRARSKVGRVVLVGRRLGGSVAALAAARSGDVDGVVLWDPVVRGSLFLDEMEGVHREWVTNYRGRVSVRQQEPEELERASGDALEAVGFRFHPEFVAQVADLDLLRLTSRPGRSVLIVDTDSKEHSGSLDSHFEKLGCKVSRRSCADADSWDFDRIDELLKQLVPMPVLKEIIAWQGEQFA